MVEDEFEVIARCFAPLAPDPGARGLRDDVAVWRPPPGQALILTTDAIVEGVHFLPDDPIETIGRKALRVALSDLAAKGATPHGYLLTLAWPRSRPAAEIAPFAAGLAEDQARFSVSMWGGDTVSTPGPLTVSVAALGAASAAPSRAGAQAGEDLWVTGVIGDGWLGLEAALGRLSGVPEGLRAQVLAHYRLPTPRFDCAPLLAGASASMDVSDGLLADAAKLAAASRVRLAIQADAVPLSAAAEAWRAAADDADGALMTLLGGGDDYEILFTAPAAHREALLSAGASRIGRVEAGEGVVIRGEAGDRPAPGAGYTHRLGR